MADTNHITKEYLNEIFEYKDGILYWKKKMARNVHIGRLVGSINQKGYFTVRVFGKKRLNHRLIYLMHHGNLPKEVDHIDGNTLNNDINNLRESTHSENICNSKLRVDSKTGVKNVSWNKRSQKYSVKLNVSGKRYEFGFYEDLELAELVAVMAREKYHGNFANHG